MLGKKVKAFYVIDGAIYIYISKNMPTSEVFGELKELGNLFVQNPKVRLVIEGHDENDIGLVLEKLSTELKLKVKISDYKTNFFGLNKQEVSRLSQAYFSQQLQISNFKDSFSFKEVDKNNSQELNIVENFIQNSFGVDFVAEGDRFLAVPSISKMQRISSNFSKGIGEVNSKMFLIKTKTQELVGCYALVNVDNDIQLESVCGLSTLENIYQGKKLPVLMGSVLEVLNTHQAYEDFESFSFTNSKEKVSTLYKSLNFKINKNRFGFMVEHI